MNRIFSVALVYCDKMSTVASLGSKGEKNNVEGRQLGNIYEHFSLKFRNVCVEISLVNIDERL